MHAFSVLDHVFQVLVMAGLNARGLQNKLLIGASLSEPLLDELAGAFLWYIYKYIYIYICIFVSMGSPFDPAWAPRKRATRKRKAG